MDVARHADHLEFDDDLVLDRWTMLSPHFRISWARAFGTLFNEPMTERIGNPERTQDDAPGHRLQPPRIPSINLHPLHPP
jgi:hypothetical protein